MQRALDEKNPEERKNKAIEEIYQKAKADLGKMFNGQMDDNLTIEHVDDPGERGVYITLVYTPDKTSAPDNIERIRIKYFVGFEYVHDLGEKPRKNMYVKIVFWQLYDNETKEWEDVLVPEKMQPTETETETKNVPCFYPRWNPQGMKYGFIDKQNLEKFYAEKEGE